MNKLLILFVGLTMGCSASSQAKNIFVRTNGDTFQYKESTLRKIDVKVQSKESQISLSTKELASNEFAVAFQSLKLAGCHSVKLSDRSLNFSPYKNYEHFLRYFKALDIGNGLIGIVDKRTPKPKTIAIYDNEKSLVCSTGVSANAAFWQRQSNTLFVAECVNGSCSISRMSSLITKTQPESIMKVRGEVVDMGYDEGANSLIVLVREFKEEDGFFGRLFSKVGHGREKYDLFAYEFNTITSKEVKYLVGKDIVNPTFWIAQSWLQ